jgi:hypothetical protein
MIGPRHFTRVLVPLLVAAGVLALVAWGARSPLSVADRMPARAGSEDLSAAVADLDSLFAERWRRAGLAPPRPAADLQVLRRLSLALHGTIPSLEEIRLFEADDRPDRLERWTRRLLADRRFAWYFAERLARGFVGNDEGPFVIFRRDRFIDWLSEQLQRNTPYDELVRTMIAAKGLWTGKPATNFVTAAAVDGDIDENKLAGKTVRAILGQRIDCAQCHDHPFAPWKQRQFHELAAYYGEVRTSLVGIEDTERSDNRPAERAMLEGAMVDPPGADDEAARPGVPFHPEWLPAAGTRRQRLAAWLTHPENQRFERAIANRIWALLFGRALVEPVDDLPDPSVDSLDPLDRLGADFREHRYDLRRLIRVIAASRPFRADSRPAEIIDNNPSLQAPAGGAEARGTETRGANAGGTKRDRTEPGTEDRTVAEPASLEPAEREWSLFPLIRLRPEQVVGAIRQSATLQTADQDSHWVFRTIRTLQEREFVKEYGDRGENELLEREGTIPQRLLLLNGKRAAEALKSNPVNAAGRIAAMASTDGACVEAAYLVCLTRRPTEAERRHFLEQLRGKTGEARQRAVEDLIWALYNGTEFSWNH